MERKISYSKYLLALIFSILILSLGFTLGIIIDSARVSWAERAAAAQETEYQSLQLQYAIISSLQADPTKCAVLHTALQKSIEELGESLERIEEYRQNSRINDDWYSLWQRRYILDNLKYWYLADKTREDCKIDIVTLLYFFSTKDCDICPNQGVILTYFKKKYDEKLLVFPIDIDLEKEEPVVGLIRARFNITEYPTIVIADVTHSGVIPKDDLGKLICNSFINRSQCVE